MGKVARGVLGGLALAVLLVGCQQVRLSGGPKLGAPAGALRVASYNVHYIIGNRAEGAWSLADWAARKGPMARAVAALDADIIAFQEMETFRGSNNDDDNLAREWLLAQVPGYEAAAIGDWRAFPSTQPIFYRPDRMRLLDQGWLMFSDTPDVAYSRTFDGSWSAFASWAEFEAEGRVFRVVNLHTDYRSGSNRTKSIALVAERVVSWDMPVIVAGDFNARAGSSLLGQMEAVGVTFADVPGATYHFNRGINLFGAIDHVGVTNGLRLAGEAVVVRSRFGDVWPTDHYPVVVDLGWE